MNFVADESLDFQIVARLRKDGFGIVFVSEMAPGISDKEVLDLANQDSALLLTADTDFGELVFRQGLISGGVILVRLAGLSPEKKAGIVSSVLTKHMEELKGAFTVVAPGHIRIRHSLK